MGAKIALIGAGSQSFGPSTIKDIFLSAPLCETGVELVLMDIKPTHLADSEQMAQRVVQKLERKAQVSATTDLELYSWVLSGLTLITLNFPGRES